VTSDMAFECLFASRDARLYSIFGQALRDLSIYMNVCLTASKAILELGKGHTDLVIVDWESEDSTELMQSIWKGGKWRTPTVVAISSSDSRLPGAHFVLKRPVTHCSGERCMKTAYSRMLWDYRQHARHPLMMPVDALGEDGHRISLTVINIGYGGVGLKTQGSLVIGDILSFRLLLPGAHEEIPARVRVLWTLDSGRAGGEFVRLLPSDLMILDEWLKAKAQVKKPLVEA